MKRLSLVSLLLFVSASAAFAQPPAISAPVVHERIRLRAKSAADSTPAKPKAELQFKLDRETREFGPFEKDQQFGVKSARGVAITLERFNPLANAISINVDDVPDPSAETLSKLVESLQSVSTILGGTATTTRSAIVLPDALIECKDQFQQADTLLGKLAAALNDDIWTSAKIKESIDSASTAIATGFAGGGALAVQGGVKKFDDFMGSDKDADDAKTLRRKLKIAKAALTDVESLAKKENTQGCDAIVHPLYLLAMTSSPGERVATMERVLKAFSDIADYLRPFSEPSRWSTGDPSDYLVTSTIIPTSSTMKKVKVTFQARSYETTATPGILTVKTTDAGSTEFTVRRYSAWVPEIGVGVTFNRVSRPVYGTGKNAAGQTTIALSETDKTTKVDPTVLVNFVCGFCGLTRLTPMFQIGTSTSKTTPAILLGGGVRVFPTAKGEFAIGYGAILPWAKQLKNDDDLGKVIDGTAALEQHLEWRVVKGFHSYVTLQYKF
jgi:hypothetical protein